MVINREEAAEDTEDVDEDDVDEDEVDAAADPVMVAPAEEELVEDILEEFVVSLGEEFVEICVTFDGSVSVAILSRDNGYKQLLSESSRIAKGVVVALRLFASEIVSEATVPVGCSMLQGVARSVRLYNVFPPGCTLRVNGGCPPTHVTCTVLHWDVPLDVVVECEAMADATKVEDTRSANKMQW